MDARGIDTNDPGWINRKFQEIKRELEALRSERRAAATTVSEGSIRLANGASLVVDGGDVIMLDEDGDELFRIGTMPHGDRGLRIRRTDGSAALTLARIFDFSSGQELVVLDRLGNPLMAEEALGSGPAYPVFHIPMQPVQPASAPLIAGPRGLEISTNATSWTDVFAARFLRHNQFGTFRVHVAASDATTTGEVRLVDASSGFHLGQFLAGGYVGSRPAGSTGFVDVLLPSIFLPGAPWAPISLAIQARRTAGSGTLRVAVGESRGGGGGG